ncbi:unnamed protein product [Mycena citricolor]|uniref:Protein PNS1 n=1 Tax=Mycena citricolor TaxID=2018698 RepID=A0AAD2HDK4_9AGAR|nr:unnamed protein product [Mycena citricolor]
MSFATYASQFLNRPPGPAASTSTEQHPMFFSFSSDADDRLDRRNMDMDIDDTDDPHFRYSSSAELPDVDDEDPYLRLDEPEVDEDTQTENAFGRKPQYPTVEQYPEDDLDSDEEGEGAGWLAHAHRQSPSPLRAKRNSTPSPRAPPRSISPPRHEHEPQSLSLALSESLLPRTGPDVHAFHLPSPYSRRRRPQPNARAAAGFLALYSVLCICSLLSLVLHEAGERPAPPALLHTIPLLTFFTVLSAFLSYLHLALVRAFLRPVLLLSALAPPLALFLSSVLAFAGSFSAGAGWGLRLFSIVPLFFAVLSVRTLPADLRRASRSPGLLALATRILFFRAPLLLLLSPIILLGGLIASLPLLTLMIRLPLSHTWYLRAASAVVVFSTLHLYFSARSLQRSAVAGTLGAWYFSVTISAPADALATGHPVLDAQLRVLHAALERPPGPLVLSALSSLVLTLLDMVRTALRWAPMALPYRPVAICADFLLGKLHAVGERVSGGAHAGVYCGLNGRGWWEAVTGVRELKAAGGERVPPPLPLPRPYMLALPFALMVYLRAAGDREGEEGVSYADQQRAAIGAAILAGAVCAAVSLFCAGVVRDCADTLYICHLIDRTTGNTTRDSERQEVWNAFDPSPTQNAPSDPEQGLVIGGYNIGNLNLGAFPFGFGGAQTEAAGRESGGQGEEPVYARMRRTSEEANRKVPPPAEPPRSQALSASAASYPTVEDGSDSDSLDSRSNTGGDSFGVFPGSGLF